MPTSIPERSKFGTMYSLRKQRRLRWLSNAWDMNDAIILNAIFFQTVRKTPCADAFDLKTFVNKSSHLAPTLQNVKTLIHTISGLMTYKSNLSHYRGQENSTRVARGDSSRNQSHWESSYMQHQWPCLSLAYSTLQLYRYDNATDYTLSSMSLCKIGLIKPLFVCWINF